MLKKNILSAFWEGFFAPLNSIPLILKSPKLLTLVTIPLIINFALYYLFFHYGSEYLSEGITASNIYLASKLPPWIATSMVWVLRIFGWLLMIVVAAISFTFISGIVCAPFNDSLCRNTIKVYLSRHAPTKKFTHVSIPLGTVVRLEFKRMLVLLFGGIFTVMIGLIPLMQIPAFILGTFLLAFEYFGYPISQKTTSLKTVVVYIFKHPMLSMGLGSFLILIMALPFTSIFYIPLAVAGGSLIYAKTHI